MAGRIRTIYQQSLKTQDSLFNLYLARPLAAVVVALFEKTRVTPNQVTFMSLVVMLLAVASFVGLGGAAGLWLGVAMVELSYVFDCADGQLARLTGRSSPIGGELDFLMDELKAYLLVGSLGARWYLYDGQLDWVLLLTVVTLIVVASAISLTKFTRLPEYGEATGTTVAKHGESVGSGRTGPLWPVKMVFRLISQYPVTLPIFAAFGAVDIFLYAYGAVHLLYVGQTSLVVLLRLGRFAPAAPDRSVQGQPTESP